MRPIDDDFADYVRARQHRLLRAAYLVCGDAHRAEDLLQQALEKLALRWDTVKHGAPDAYVRRILYRDAVSSWRRTRREHLRAVPPEPDAAHPGGHGNLGDRVGDRVDLDAALARLTRKQRAVLVLRFFEDRSEADTADVLGVTVGTVKSQTHTALANLRELVPHLAPALRQEDPS